MPELPAVESRHAMGDFEKHRCCHWILPIMFIFFEY